MKLRSTYVIDYNSADLDSELIPAPACLTFCDYLIKAGKMEDFLGIKVALALCLHGYAEAGAYGQKIRDGHDRSLGVLALQAQSDIYPSWLTDYTAEWYLEAHQNGIDALDLLLEATPMSEQRLMKMCQMFKDVMDSEISFCNEIVKRVERAIVD